MRPPKPKPKPNTISSTGPRPVAGNAQGRASEFYKGKTQPVYATKKKGVGAVLKKSGPTPFEKSNPMFTEPMKRAYSGPNRAVSAKANTGRIITPATPKKPKKLGGR